MTSGKLNEETVKRLQVPAKGNRVTYFAGAVIQGAKAPRGFGVRVTASGARAFVLNCRLRGREHRFTIGAWPDWSALKAVREARGLRQRVDRGENPVEDRTPPPSTAMQAKTALSSSARSWRKINTASASMPRAANTATSSPKALLIQPRLFGRPCRMQRRSLVF